MTTDCLPIDLKPTDKMSIFIGERLCAEDEDPDDTWYHTFLMLVKKDDSNLTILQQLHFMDAPLTEPRTFDPEIRIGIHNRYEELERFKDVKAARVFEDSAFTTLKRWNWMLGHAHMVKVNSITFDIDDYKYGVHSSNCRAGVIAALASVGIKSSQTRYASKAGTLCQRMPLANEFNEASLSDAHWEKLLESNENYCSILDSELDGRYVGPFVGHFQPM